ncbi:NINE protein [Eubacterium barkeri]|uniref:Sel1 repeat-containing protein n=1 Tax=Eubacterium barkeri TaxID=1528 RepID=A0A1H3CBU6_EUBBA|nr:NINE protein [Eubacterium barkeri]SDX51591.1 Sel1 repeat-containing protein [Eubacterium barkeri]
MSDFEEVIKLAENGDVSAQEEVAISYYKGINEPKDIEKAMQFFRLAADNGSGLANFRLGRAYETGTGAELDLIKARQFYQKAANLGYQNAVNKLVALDTSEQVAKETQCQQTEYVPPKPPTLDLNQQSYNQSNNKPKSKVVAILLALFLGGFGIHNFYLGNIKSGIIQLLLCWTGVSYLWALIDLIRIAIGDIPADANGVKLK